MLGRGPEGPETLAALGFPVAATTAATDQAYQAGSLALPGFRVAAKPLPFLAAID
ncbi:MAG: hypothetical protein N0C90_11970 [Candidatus Thiodiazotropha endolucinida]|nr:hypothetical protein [Candidatus Thiodiazotropha taylori]MCW4262077.1 hypothetical protein [Candidatus Thiodiazotropha endolucinida]